ncbi:TDE2712 family protein [Tepidibacter formicigenes]|jgi:hypothetical protein|uniref:Uncharacterized protein n=1 Tax=Tepidibacter formicigenes DSM 15518 TaxID=1123349 RepID=A0A1M6S8Q2_9FIRM|nr:hypothetical protein [Tepidibacter formicigenes]SHK41152.1 hypothetical protein SAMN02744037_02284 [Tepidibacter formicigenes DSM 15518]
MIERIKVKLDIIEGMLYYWQATSEREKVGEAYMNNIAEFPEMKYIYDDEFNGESVRKVLSAISNRELLNNGSKKERKFWNNNMWMMEDLEYTNMMVAPIKILNLDSIIDRLNNKNENSKYEELEVVFIPGHQDEYLIEDNKLIINFFRVKPDLYEEDKVTIGDTILVDYIEEKLIELINK